MKTNLLKSAVLMSSLLGALSSASAETLHARIPFAFSAGGNSMPAGNYNQHDAPRLNCACLRTKTPRCRRSCSRALRAACLPSLRRR